MHFNTVGINLRKNERENDKQEKHKISLMSHFIFAHCRYDILLCTIQ